MNDFCKSMGHHPLEICYGYMHAQSTVDRHRSESAESKSSNNNINKRNLTPGPERQDRLYYVDGSCNLKELHEQYGEALNC